MTSADDALAAAAEADAEAAEAEAVAAAARARARAIRLRREAAEAAAAETAALEAKAKADVEAAAPKAAAPTAEETTVAEEPAAEELEGDEPAVGDLADDDLDADGRDDLDDLDDDEDDLDAPAPEAWKVIAKALVASVALVGSIALLGLSVAMYVHHKHVETQQSQTAEFAAAARQGVVTLMSLDFNKAKEDVQRIIDNTTGDFKKDFEGQSDDFIKVAEASKVITTANVNAAAVQSMSANDATVLVAVTTNVSNTASKQQEPRSWRLKVGMTREGDQIKLSKVEFVP